MANEHVFNNSIIVTGSISSSVGFYGDGTGLTGITAVAEWDGSRNGDASITGSLIISGSGVNVDFTNTTGVSGSFSGSFSGDGSGLTGVSAEWDGTRNGNASITGSLGILNGNVNLDANAYFFQGTSTGGSNVSLIGVSSVDTVRIGNSGYDNIIPDDVFIEGNLTISGSLLASGSTVNFLNATSVTGSFSGDGSGLTNLTLPSGVVSGSAQISYTGITDVPANIISSSAQFTTITNPFTGSFTGSFTGDGSGLTGVTATAVGGIFQTGSANGAIKTNDTSYTSIASGQYSFAGGGRFVTASADYAIALGGYAPQATGAYSVALGGNNTCAKAIGALALGYSSIASGSYSVGIGQGHIVRGFRATAIGGYRNEADGDYGISLGGSTNYANGLGSSVLGGSVNLASGIYSSVVGGENNIASTSGSVILGGSGLSTSKPNEVVATTLTISGSGTFDTGDGKHVGILRLANRGGATPGSADVGSLMVSGSNLFFYGESGWVQIN